MSQLALSNSFEYLCYGTTVIINIYMKTVRALKGLSVCLLPVSLVISLMFTRITRLSVNEAPTTDSRAVTICRQMQITFTMTPWLNRFGSIPRLHLMC